METMVALAAVLGLAWWWLDTARARDGARALAAQLCREAGVQLLDQTVSLRRSYLLRTPRGLRLARRFQFEFSESGEDRSPGMLVLLSGRLQRATLDGERIGRVVIQPQ